MFEKTLGSVTGKEFLNFSRQIHRLVKILSDRVRSTRATVRLLVYGKRRSRYVRRVNLDGKYTQRIAWLLISCAAPWLAFEIPRGRLTTSDELFTAERSREMILLGPWQVHLNFEPSYSKPPLQYWLTTWTLSLADARYFFSREIAVRIWPLVFGILSAIALIKLARSIDNSTNSNRLVLLSFVLWKSANSDCGVDGCGVRGESTSAAIARHLCGAGFCDCA